LIVFKTCSMLHFTGVNVASALFFETPEQIFSRVFLELKPRTPVPSIEVRFCRFANANSKIQLKQGKILARITDVLEPAPAPVLEALAWVLLSKLYRQPVPADELLRYKRYIQRKDLREKIHEVRQERGRKLIAEAQGDIFNLDELFDHLNFRYFFGLMPKPAIGWSLRVSRGILGHYDPSHHTIVLSKRLDQHDVPQMVVEYVMFHEMLHIKYPTEHRSGRRCVHTAEFKAAEKQFEMYKEAKEAIKRLD
jgi:hypothetical protein